MTDPREASRARKLVGKRVTCGAPGSDEYDTGIVKKAGTDGRILVAWKTAGEEYWEHPETVDIEGES